jgi:molecular chaperone DnaK
MIRDAEQHSEDDHRRREEAEARNNADTLVYRTEKLLKDEGDKFTGDEKQKVESALKELKEALAGQDASSIRAKTEDVLRASQAFAQRLYEQSSNQSASTGSSGGSGTSAPSDDEVVDAEIVDEPGQAEG